MVLKELYRVEEDAQKNFLKEVRVIFSLVYKIHKSMHSLEDKFYFKASQIIERVRYANRYLKKNFNYFSGAATTVIFQKEKLILTRK